MSLVPESEFRLHIQFSSVTPKSSSLFLPFPPLFSFLPFLRPHVLRASKPPRFPEPRLGYRSPRRRRGGSRALSEARRRRRGTGARCAACGRADLGPVSHWECGRAGRNNGRAAARYILLLPFDDRSFPRFGCFSLFEAGEREKNGKGADMLKSRRK